MISLFLAFVLILIGIIYILKAEKKTAKQATIPGPKRNERGTFDVNDYGNQLKYIDALHKKYGPIVSFWEGDKMSVSIASPELMKETRHLTDITTEINEPFRSLVGNDALIFLNGEEAKERRKLYDQFFMLKAVKTYFDIIKEIADEFVNKWKTYTENDHIPIMDTVTHLATKSILRTCYGDYFADDEKLSTFRKNYEFVVNTIGMSMKPDSEEEKRMENAINRVKVVVQEILAARQEELKQGANPHLFIDVLLENAISEDQKNSDGLTFFVASDAASFFFIWIIYELAKDLTLQERIYEEIKSVAGEKSIDREDLSKLKFLRQVIDETIRYYSSFHTGRISDKDMTLGKYFIPKGTNIYQHLGASLKDSNYWEDAEKFDPDHFNPEKTKGRSPFAFKPFGCSGKRVCPGMSYSYVLISSFIAIWLQNFKLQLVPGQKITLSDSVFKKPADEVWFTVTPRK